MLWEKADSENETLKKEIKEFQAIQKQHEIELKNLEIDLRNEFDQKFQDTIKSIIGEKN